jgi:hypothetical protein
MVCQEIHDFIGRRFTVIIDVRLVTQAYNQHPQPFKGLAIFVKGFHQLLDDIPRHRSVDLRR